MEQRKETIRTCVGCGNSQEKHKLVRVVRTPEGHILFDASGKMNGRGSYLCTKTECFERARKGHKLDSSLKVNLRDDDYNRLRRDFDAFLTQDAQ